MEEQEGNGNVMVFNKEITMARVILLGLCKRVLFYVKNSHSR